MDQEKINNKAGSSSRQSSKPKRTNPKASSKTSTRNTAGSSRRKAESLKFEDLVETSQDIISIENYKFIASYNWVDDNSSTILVPGAPPLWVPPSLPVQLSSTTAKQRADNVKDRVVTSRWSSLFAALRVMQPTYSFASIFLVVERNSLRKLFDFSSGRSAPYWRIIAEVVNNTLFLTRWEKNENIFLAGSGEPGYGPSFEEHFLQPEDDVQGTCAHHRIVEYEIGGMKWLVRFEADGYLGNEQKLDSDVSETAVHIQNVVQSMESMTLDAERQIELVEGLNVVRKGHLIPDASIMEAKCRSAKAQSNTRAKTTQCWFSQTTHLFVGHENNGAIWKIEEKDMVAAFIDWEKSNQENLRRLVRVVREIECNVRGKGSCFVVNDKYQEPRALQFLESGLETIVSEDVKQRHWRR